MKNVFLIFPVIFIFFHNWPMAVPTPLLGDGENYMKFNGAAPALVSEGDQVHMVFATGDSILYSLSTDNGKKFSVPLMAGYLPKLSIGGGRGPQIVSSNGQLIIAVVDQAGNIFTFIKKKNTNSWERGKRINDVPDIAKEGFVSLASNDKGDVYAVWLDLRDDKMNKVAGASSADGGKSWSKNRIIYKSPDSTVCECCKPSVKMKDQLVVVMFRNWLHGNRDLHIIQSQDGGIHFDQAQKLGAGSWKLNACPMDGGGLVIDENRTIHTVWRRQENIFTCEAGQKEILIGEGKQCTIAGSTSNRFIAYVNKGSVFCQKPDENKVELGQGKYPEILITATNSALCAWEYGGKIYSAVLYK